jgi:hypothetical protein
MHDGGESRPRFWGVDNVDEDISGPERQFVFISEEADEALELIFEHPDGISERLLAHALGFDECSFLIDELRAAGIDVRSQVRNRVMVYLPPLKRR